MRLVTKALPASGHLSDSLNHVSQNVLESDDAFMHRFQHSFVQESFLLLATEHNKQLLNEKESASDMRSLTQIPDTVTKELGKLNLFSEDATVHNTVVTDSINAPTIFAHVSDAREEPRGRHHSPP